MTRRLLLLLLWLCSTNGFLQPQFFELPTPKRKRPLSARLDSNEFSEQGRWRNASMTESMRVDAFLCAMAPDFFLSQTSAKKTIRRGLVLINDSPAVTSSVVGPADSVSSYTRTSVSLLSDRMSSDVLTGSPPLQVLFEDDHIAVVNKPQGVPVFEAPLTVLGKQTTQSLYTQLLAQLRPTRAALPLGRPQPAHRLDRETGGLLVAAKTRPALQRLSSLFSSRQVHKEYTALCCNVFEEGTEACQGSIVIPLDGRDAHTDYQVLECFPAFPPFPPFPSTPSQLTRKDGLNGLTKLKLVLHSGRTHQIRRHLDMLSPPHPVLYDKAYGFSNGERRAGRKARARERGQEQDNDQSKDKRGKADEEITSSETTTTTTATTTEYPHCLWSTRLRFPHPASDEQVDVILPESQLAPILARIVADWLG